MKPLRLVVVCPSWVGDAVMATPALRLLRSRLPGCYLGALVRPGIDQIFAGSDLFDEVHADRPGGVMGYKHVAARLRARRYDTALLLTNSFSTALIARLAGIPRRIGYSRDARAMLLTEALPAPKRPDGRWAMIPAAAYYWHAARCLLGDAAGACPSLDLPPDILPMELSTTEQEAEEAAELLRRAEAADAPFVILNPGGNNPAKRWPAERFIDLGRHVAEKHNLRVLVNGSPGEADLARQIAAGIGAGAASLAALGVTIGSLKALLARRLEGIPQCRVVVTNDTGPRHIAAAFGVPVVALFGPTDPRWTTIPVSPQREAILVADPTLPPEEVADDHPERCRIERIETDRVLQEVERMLSQGQGA